MAEPRQMVEGGHKFAPGAPLAGQRPAAFGSEVVEAAAPLAGLFHPLALHQAFALQAVQKRIERRHVELELVFRFRFDKLGELVAVAGAVFEQRQDNHPGATLLEVADISRCHICRLYIWQWLISSGNGTKYAAGNRARPGKFRYFSE